MIRPFCEDSLTITIILGVTFSRRFWVAMKSVHKLCWLVHDNGSLYYNPYKFKYQVSHKKKKLHTFHHTIESLPFFQSFFLQELLFWLPHIFSLNHKSSPHVLIRHRLPSARAPGTRDVKVGDLEIRVDFGSNGCCFFRAEKLLNENNMKGKQDTFMYSLYIYIYSMKHPNSKLTIYGMVTKKCTYINIYRISIYTYMLFWYT